MEKEVVHVHICVNVLGYVVPCTCMEASGFQVSYSVASCDEKPIDTGSVTESETFCFFAT